MFKKIPDIDAHACWIITSPRTGSTYLCDVLNSVLPQYKNIEFMEHFTHTPGGSYYTRKIFNDTWEKLKKKGITQYNHGYSLNLKYQKEVRKIFINKEMNYFLDNPNEPLLPTRNKMMSNVLEWFGFNSQNKEDYRKIDFKKIHDKIENKIPNIKYIHLVRKDMIAQSVSLYHAESSGIFTSKEIEKINPSYAEDIIPFNFHKIMEKYEGINHLKTLCDLFFDSISKEQYMTVFYEDLRDSFDDEIIKIGKFLNYKIDLEEVKKKNKTYPTTKKENELHRRLFKEVLTEKEKTNGMVCSAARNYIMVKWNGSIFKCYAHSGFYDHDIEKLKIGNIQDIDLFDHKINSICENYCCSKNCDMLGTQQWDSEGTLIERNKRMMLWPAVEKFEELNPDNFAICIDLVSGCSNKCPYCWITKNKLFNINYIEGKYWIDFIQYINDNKKGIKFLNISGLGESTFHPDFCQIVNKALSLNFDVAVTTSALNLNNKNLKQISHNLSDDNKEKFSVVISLHPLSPLWSEEKIEQLLKEFHANNYFKIAFNFVEFPQNMKFKDELIELGNKYGIQEFRSVEYLLK